MIASEQALAYGAPSAQRPNKPKFESRGYEVVEAVPAVPPIPYIEFSTAVFEPLDQFTAWHDSFASMLELTAAPTKSGFKGSQKIWDLGPLVLARFSTDQLAFASLAGHVRRDPLDHWTMTLLTTGTNRTEAGKRAFTGHAGEVQVHSLGRRFEGDISASDMLMLFVPRDLSLETAAVLEAAEFSTLKTGMGKLFSDYLLNVAGRLPTLTTADLPGLASATRAMILACVAPSADHMEAAAEPIATVLLERARKLIQARLLEPKLGSEFVRRELGVSRTKLYNLFEPFGGVMHYIQHRRLLSAHAALTDLNDRRLIFQIAEERGFTDGAEFSRAFKRAFGYSPSDVRRRGGAGVPIRTDAEDCLPQDRLNRLLRRLQG